MKRQPEAEGLHKSVNIVPKFNIFALYSLPIIFPKIFSLTALARLRFIPHLEMKACNVLYRLHLYFFGFWGHYR